MLGILRNGKSIMESAITGSDGEVDAGYLALFWLMWMIIGVIPIMVVGSFVGMYFHQDKVFDVQALGVGIGAVCGGFAAAVGGIGAFRMGDKPRVLVDQRTAPIAMTGANATANVAGVVAPVVADIPATTKGKK